MKKTTMKDIAKASEVSVATVSYVLNNNEKETIPEDTRNRILKIANELNYVPSLTARSLAKKQSGLIGIILVFGSEDLPLWKKNYYAELISEMEKLLQKNGYHVLVTQLYDDKANLDIILKRDLEGAFLFDVKEDYVYELSSRFKVPIVIIDSIIDDTIFHKVIPNFEKALLSAKAMIKTEKSFLVIDSFNNRGIVEKIKKQFDPIETNIYEMGSLAGLQDFLLQQENRQGIIINEALSLWAERYISPSRIVTISSMGLDFLKGTQVKKVVFNNKTKAKAAVDILVSCLKEEYLEEKYTVVDCEI